MYLPTEYLLHTSHFYPHTHIKCLPGTSSLGYIAPAPLEAPCSLEAPLASAKSVEGHVTLPTRPYSQICCLRMWNLGTKRRWSVSVALRGHVFVSRSQSLRLTLREKTG